MKTYSFFHTILIFFRNFLNFLLEFDIIFEFKLNSFCYKTLFSFAGVYFWRSTDDVGTKIQTKSAIGQQNVEKLVLITNQNILHMLHDIRTNYQKFELTGQTVNKDPIQQLTLWLNDAIADQILDSTSMVLSTIDQTGNPESRVVLLKKLTPEGLIFFTNYNSKKGTQITANRHVSVVFFWPELERQIRIRGKAEKISKEDSESYFKSRPLESQLGAWSSPQSEIIESRQILDDNYAHFQKYFTNHEIKKPPHWGGYLIRPEYFEFWQGRSNRLHDRIEFCREDQKWMIHRLAP